MSYPVYTVYAGDVLPIFFDSFDGGTGASITMTGLAVTDIEIYKDGSKTQRASDAGYTLLDTDGIDFDAITGIHGFSIDTGDNTDAGFFAVGSWFHVVVSSITIDAQTVNFVAAAFRIVAAETVAGVPVVNMTDWVDGGRLDLLLDAIKVPTDKLVFTVANKVDSNVYTWNGTAVSAPATAGIPEVNLKNIANAAVSATTAQLGVNVVQISGDATAADNCELDYDGTGYAGGTIVKTADVTKWLGQAALAVVNGSPVCTLGATQAAYAPAKAGDAMLITAGTGAGQLDFASGVVKANLVQILATALTETGGYLAAGFKKFFNVATPVHTVASVDQGADSNTILTDLHNTDIPAVKTDTAAIKAKTDMQPTVWYSA